jgi:hypothetical protein
MLAQHVVLESFPTHPPTPQSAKPSVCWNQVGWPSQMRVLMTIPGIGKKRREMVFYVRTIVAGKAVFTEVYRSAAAVVAMSEHAAGSANLCNAFHKRSGAGCTLVIDLRAGGVARHRKTQIVQKFFSRFLTDGRRFQPNPHGAPPKKKKKTKKFKKRKNNSGSFGGADC